MTVRKKFNLTPTQVQIIEEFIKDLQSEYGKDFIPILEYTFVEGGTVVVYNPRANLEMTVDAQEEIYQSPYKDL